MNTRTLSVLSYVLVEFLNTVSTRVTWLIYLSYENLTTQTFSSLIIGMCFSLLETIVVGEGFQNKQINKPKKKN